MDSLALPDAASSGSDFFVYRNNLRKLSLKIVLKHGILPTALALRDVNLVDNRQRGVGGFADVFLGTYEEYRVAIKRLRVYIMSPESQRQTLRKVRSYQILSDLISYKSMHL